MTDTTEALASYQTSMGDRPVLGHVVLFSVNGAWVTPADLKQWFDDLDLNEAFLPNPIKRAEAFRDAYSPSGQGHRLSWEVDPLREVTGTLRCEEVTLSGRAKKDRIVRQVVLKLTNATTEDVDFDTVIARATFHKATRDPAVITESGIDPTYLPWVRQYLDELWQRYQRNCDFYDSDTLRGVLRRYVVSLNATMLTPGGGAYFVHESRTKTLRKLQELAARFSTRTSLYTIPLPDEPVHRDMVADAFKAEIVNQADKLLETVLTLNHAGTVAKAKVNQAVGAYADIKSRINEYVTGIGLQRDRVEASLELVEDALTDLVGKADSD